MKRMIFNLHQVSFDDLNSPLQLRNYILRKLQRLSYCAIVDDFPKKNAKGSFTCLGLGLSRMIQRGKS